jgi:hypothetical protein
MFSIEYSCGYCSVSRVNRFRYRVKLGWKTCKPNGDEEEGEVGVEDYEEDEEEECGKEKVFWGRIGVDEENGV